jgi:type II secretory ATPase GspE/PulE/Tfp pilus assembly ATPase PilB-like protein
MQSYKRRTIGAILIERGSLDPEKLPAVLEQLGSTKQRFGEICVREGFIDAEQLAMALAEQFNMTYYDLADFRMDEEILNTLPPEAIYRFRFVPLELTPEYLVVAVSDPTDVITLDELDLLIDRPLQIRIASDAAISSVLKAGEGARRMLREVSEDFMLQLVKETDRGEEVISAETITEDTSPIIKLVNTTLMDALNRRASDIHIETGHEGLVIKYRIDGVLYMANDPIDLHFQAPIISRLKVMSELDISERRIPQDGRFKIRFGAKSIDFRVSIMPSSFGEDAVIRILDKA